MLADVPGTWGFLCTNWHLRVLFFSTDITSVSNSWHKPSGVCKIQHMIGIGEEKLKNLTLCRSLTPCWSHGECMSPCMFVAPPWKMIEVSNAKASSSMLGSNVVAIIQNVPYRQNDCSLPCFWWGWPCIVRWLPADITWMEDWVFTQFFLFILRKTEF